MFSKNYKLKASNSLKSSYRKILVQKLQKIYSSITEDDFKEIIPPKANLTAIKVITSSEEQVTIYSADNIPILIEANENFYPTIYTLWRCPHMVKYLTIESHLAEKLQEGLIHVRRSHLPPFGSKLPNFLKHEVLGVNTFDNPAAILVGIAQYSSCDMLIVQMGICVKTINIIGDMLYSNEKFTKISRPSLELSSFLPKIENSIDNIKISELLINMSIADSNDKETQHNVNMIKDIEINDFSVNKSQNSILDDENDTSDSINTNPYPDNMDEMLKYCLLCVLKSSAKNIELPLKTNLLYANHMVTFCPSDKLLDIKKSSYKKLGKFLEAMEKEDLIKIKEIEKGVDAIININFGHDQIKNHYIINTDTPELKIKNDDSNYKVPTIREVFKITAAVLPLFKNMKRGQVVLNSEVKLILANYVKENDLQDINNKNLVKINPLLGTFVPINTNTISWENLMSNILNKMTACTEICHQGGKPKLTGKLKQITMQVANRSGNKKVTIVSNLEEYGLNLSILCKEFQHGVAASCSIMRLPDSKTDQILVQGNQTYFITKHLIEIYGLPKKFIEGADKILSKKKK